MKIQAKFLCDSITESHYGGKKSSFSVGLKPTLTCWTSEDLSVSTPINTSRLVLGDVSEKVARSFKVGAEYIIDFAPAEGDEPIDFTSAEGSE